MSKRGFLLALEGIDGTGKETQISLLKKEFPNLKIFKYPSQKTPQLNDYLEGKIEFNGKDLFQLFLNDILAEQNEVKKELENNSIVILDRYVLSTLAYEKEGISYEEAKSIIQHSNILIPDKIILLDITPEESYKRKNQQKVLDRYEQNLNYLSTVRNNFLKLFEEKFLCEHWVKINSMNSIYDVQRTLKSHIKNKWY